MRTKRFARLALGAALLGGMTLAGAAPAHAAATVNGAGSTWSQIAVDQWRADVARQGLVINFQGVGSTAGRVAYIQEQADFAVSEIPFQPALPDRNGNLSSDETQLAAKRPYAYLPIVAGGTSFMYNLSVNGQRVADLQLSPTTLAKIFNGSVKTWNDPAIAADNPGRVMPATRIKPVIRSDGSGTSAQFTAFMASETPTEWSYLCQQVGLAANCPVTSLYPDYPNSGFAAQQFSDGVANFVAAPFNDGAITYVEYGYAKERGFPVASIKNAAGQFTQPSAVNVSIALQGARINADGTQVLSGVYRFSDPRTYPVSSYSYMIVPTSTASPFTAEKGEVLSRFILYFLCAGQQKSEQLGYSPLPKNLVQVAFDAVKRIPGAVTVPDIDSCSNPTITGQFITPVATTAPPTTAPVTTAPGGGGGGGGGGDNGGQGGGDGSGGGGDGNGGGDGSSATTTLPGAGGTGDGSTATTIAGGGPDPGTGSQGSAQGGSAGTGGQSSGAGGSEGSSGSGDPGTGKGSSDGVVPVGQPSLVGGDASAPSVDPVTGQPVLAAAVSVELPEQPGQGVPAVVYVVIALVALAAVFAPPAIAARMRGGRAS